MITALYIALVFLLVLANGFFVASEFALVGVRRSRIETLAEHGSASAVRLLRLLNNLNGYISATQLGITMASCRATSTCWPWPLYSRASRANTTPTAASMLPW